MKNFLYKKNDNKFKKAFALRKFFLAASLMLFIFILTAVCAPKGQTLNVMAGTSLCVFAPFSAGVKGTKAANGHDETDAEFETRKGKAETDEAYGLRQVKELVSDGVKIAMAEFKPELQALKEKVEKLKPEDSEGLEAILKELRKHGLELKSLKDASVNSNRHKSAKDQLAQFLTEKKDELAALYKNPGKILEFKAATTMSTTSASVPEGIPDIQGVQVAPPKNVNLRSTLVDSFCNRFVTSQASYAYTETLPKEGDFAFLAEAAVKTLLDWSIQTRYAPPKKVAAYQLLTEESVTDIPGLQSIAYDYLRRKHDLKRANKILFGSGSTSNVGDEPCGAITGYSVNWAQLVISGAAAALANQVVAPNFFDIVNAIVTAIATTHNYTDEMPYEANVCMINPADFYIQLVSAKTSFGTPLYPQASLFNRVTIGNCTVIADPYIPAGKIFVADMSRYNVSDYVPYAVKIGWINDNFIHNQFVILGESRLHAFVKNLDRVAFVYDDIATISAAITKV